jgi:hypothetical protein
VIEDFDVGAESDYGADDRKIMEIGGWSVGVFRSAGKFYAALDPSEAVPRWRS